MLILTGEILEITSWCEPLNCRYYYILYNVIHICEYGSGNALHASLCQAACLPAVVLVHLTAGFAIYQLPAL